MNIAVIGTGYVGLVTGACLANTGNRVTCMDKDPEQVELLKNGQLPIYEEGLKGLVERNQTKGRLSFTTDPENAVRENDVIFIAVGTPQAEDGSADISNVVDVAEMIGKIASEDKIVVCKSTVPVGTSDRVKSVISEFDSTVDVSIVSNPEFLKEGSAVQDFQSPDRVVIGAYSDDAAEKIGKLYRPFMRRSDRIVYMEPRSAEMTKYASNSMLATKISFINEMANICEAVDADIEDVREGMSLDERIGPHFIYPGVGYGGSCFPKDIRALAYLGDEKGAEPQILPAVTDVNERQKERLYHAASARFDELAGKTFAVWGLSFKPKTDDIREAPALINIRKLCQAGASVKATDPEAIGNAEDALEDVDNVSFSRDDYEVLEGVDGLFIFTEWEEFRNPDFSRMRRLMECPIIFDGRNLFDLEQMEASDFEYFCIGRPRV